jgi:hypothetical protein
MENIINDDFIAENDSLIDLLENADFDELLQLFINDLFTKDTLKNLIVEKILLKVQNANDKHSLLQQILFRFPQHNICGRQFKDGTICSNKAYHYEYCKECMEIELGFYNEEEEYN